MSGFGEDARRMSLDPLFFPDLLSADIVVAVSTEDWPAPAGLTLEDVLLDIQGEGVERIDWDVGECPVKIYRPPARGRITSITSFKRTGT